MQKSRRKPIKNKQIKAQVAIQYMLLLTLVIGIALTLYLSYSLIVSKSTIKPFQPLIKYNLQNIYGENSSFSVISSQNLTVNKTFTADILLNFMNKTNKSVSVNYTISKEENLVDGQHYYIFNTSSFPVLTNNITTANAKLLFIKTISNYTNPLLNTSEDVTIYNMSYYKQVPYFHLMITTTPEDSGLITPNNSGYYKEGSKIEIYAENTSKYSFLRWYGIGNKNYTGSSPDEVVILDSNVTEYAYFEPKLPINFKSNYKTKFLINTNNFSTNLTENLTLYKDYQISFPTSFYSNSNNDLYKFNYLSICGNKQQSNTYSFTMTDGYDNCTVVANYTKSTLLNLNFSTENSGYEITASYKNGTTIASEITSNSSYYVTVGSTVDISTSKIGESSGRIVDFSNFSGIGQNSISTNSSSFSVTINNPITEKENFKIYTYLSKITIKNNGQLITNPNVFLSINVLNYSSLLYNSNYTSIYFEFINQTTIPAWIMDKSNNSLQIILKLPITMSEGQNITILLANTSQNTFENSNYQIGESPSISPKYGEYDNGNKVMPLYYNFAGSSSTVPSGLSVVTTSPSFTAIQNNGLIITDDCYDGYDCSDGIDVYTSSRYPTTYTLLTEVLNGGADSYIFGASTSISQYIPPSPSGGGLGGGCIQGESGHGFGNPSILGPGYFIWSQGGAPGGISYWTGSSYYSLINDCYGTPEFTNFTWSGDYISGAFSNQSSQFYTIENTEVANQQDLYYYLGEGDSPGTVTTTFSYFALANFGNISYSMT